jgi:CheY-like chemotaxis protein
MTSVAGCASLAPWLGQRVEEALNSRDAEVGSSWWDAESCVRVRGAAEIVAAPYPLKPQRHSCPSGVRPKVFVPQLEPPGQQCYALGDASGIDRVRRRKKVVLSDQKGKRTVRVLIVDDDPLFRLAVAAALSADERLEFEVAEAGDGQQCLEAVASRQPDVVVLDLKMPVLDGIAAAEVIEQKWPRVRVVMLTSSDSSDDRSRAEQAGVEAFVRKAHILDGQLASLIGGQLADPVTR